MRFLTLLKFKADLYLYSWLAEVSGTVVAMPIISKTPSSVCSSSTLTTVDKQIDGGPVRVLETDTTLTLRIIVSATAPSYFLPVICASLIGANGVVLLEARSIVPRDQTVEGVNDSSVVLVNNLQEPLLGNMLHCAVRAGISVGKRPRGVCFHA